MLDWSKYNKAQIPLEIWAWDHREFFDEDYFRYVGNAIAWSRLPKHIESMLRMQEKTGCKIAIRVHPWKPPKVFREYHPEKVPHDLKQKELDRIERELKVACTLLQGQRPHYVIVDLETWKRNKERTDDYNYAMFNRWRDIELIIESIFSYPNMEGYNYSPIHRCWSLREEFPTASCSAYYIGNKVLNSRNILDTITWQQAKGLHSTTLYTTFGAGWFDSPRKWTWDFPEKHINYNYLANLLKTIEGMEIHKLIDYSAWHIKNIEWQCRLTSFLDRLINGN